MHNVIQRQRPGQSYKDLVKVGPQSFFPYLPFYGTYFLAKLVRSVKNASLFQKFTLNLIGFACVT